MFANSTIDSLASGSADDYVALGVIGLFLIVLFVAIR